MTKIDDIAYRPPETFLTDEIEALKKAVNQPTTGFFSPNKLRTDNDPTVQESENDGKPLDDDPTVHSEESSSADPTTIAFEIAVNCSTEWPHSCAGVRQVLSAVQRMLMAAGTGSHRNFDNAEIEL